MDLCSGIRLSEFIHTDRKRRSLSKERLVQMCQRLNFTHGRADFVVVENFNAGSLLGKKTATELGLLRVGLELPSTINQITVGSTQAIVDKHDAVFRGVGKLKDYQLKIHVDPEVTPVAQPQRRVPFHVRKDMDKKIKELQDLDIVVLYRLNRTTAS